MKRSLLGSFGSPVLLLSLFANLVACQSTFWDSDSQSVSVGTIDNTPGHSDSECWQAAYSYDAQTNKIHAMECEGGKKLPTTDRMLSTAERTELDAALSNVKITSSTDCVAGAQSIVATVTDDRIRPYLDEHNFCFGEKDDAPIDHASAQALVQTLHELASKSLAP
jgi:hypothetical protein